MKFRYFFLIFKIFFFSLTKKDKVNKLKENKNSLLMPSTGSSSAPTAVISNTPKYSPKFIQLYQKQMSPAVVTQTPYKKLDDLIKETEKPTNNHQSSTYLKPILRKVPSSSSISSNGSTSNSASSVDQQANNYSPQSPASPEIQQTKLKVSDYEAKSTEDNLVRVDNTSCVLPSKMRQRSQSLADQNLVPLPQSNLGNLSFSSYSAKPGYTSVNSRLNNYNARSNGFVKNSPTTTSHSGSFGVAKR